MITSNNPINSVVLMENLWKLLNKILCLIFKNITFIIKMKDGIFSMKNAALDCYWSRNRVE